MIAISIAAGALVQYLGLPPSYLMSRVHIWYEEAAFSDLVELFDLYPELQEINLEPGQTVRIVGAKDGVTIDWDAAELSRIATLLQEVAAGPVNRRGNYISFYGGSVFKRGRDFEVRALYGGDWTTAIEQNEIPSCLSMPVFRELSGECLDAVNQDWAIHYLWIEMQ
jgi:hypothetical protein